MLQRGRLDTGYSAEISVCERWAGDYGFLNFYADMGPMPKDGQKYTIDRIDTLGNYEPGNCRWATYSTQLSNRRPVSEATKKKLSLAATLQWQRQKRSTT